MAKQEYFLGIELGSTNIKAVLIDNSFRVVAKGNHAWENAFRNGYFTYSEEEIIEGLQDCYSHLKEDFEKQYANKPTNIKAIGISGMMHGYLALDENDKLLVPFRTWRNTTAEKAAEKLSDLFQFHIPCRWSVAHLYQAILDKEQHVSKISHLTTLAGYIHYLLTSEKTIGIGDASGMFPVDSDIKNYDQKMMSAFDDLPEVKEVGISLQKILPKINRANQIAGRLTKNGALLLDPTGQLEPGIVLCPPEGDSSTGIIATDSLEKNTGNISAGTSVFAMVTLDRKLSSHHEEIDIVSSPDGDDVAMVHCNNCSGEINNVVSLFEQYDKLMGRKKADDIYQKLFLHSLKGDDDCHGVIASNMLSGEHTLKIPQACPLIYHSKEISLANLMKAEIYSSFIALKMGLDILKNKEEVHIERFMAQGGIFKTKDVASVYLASALQTKISLMNNTMDGGPFGAAVLASFLFEKKLTLKEYLKKKVFAKKKLTDVFPVCDITTGFEIYEKNFRSLLPLLKNITKKEEKEIRDLKEIVLQANLDLVRNHLVLFTWGNVSQIDREHKRIVIKPSGVSYEKMSAEDMVVLDLDGNVVEGKYKPSSDTKTHVEIYKAHPEIGGIVHTHSTYATAFAQAGRNIPAYGTTHADYFYGDIPCARDLTKEEIESDYEKNTGLVINELFSDKDMKSIPGCLISHHGVFAFGKDAKEAVYHASVIEEVAKMALLSEQINPDVKKAPSYLMDKHYQRKHGKNAYYGQGKKD